MSVLLLAFCLVVVFAVYGVAGHLDGRVRRHGPHALAYRWFSGEAWHGRAISDRGWFRPGRKALTPTGHAHRRYFLPRWQHAAWRTGYTLGATVTGAGLLFQPSRTLAYLAVTGGAGGVYGGVRGWGRLQSWGHRRNYVRPLHVRLATKAGIPVANKPESWLEVPKDRSYAVLTWPQGAPLPKPQERDEIASAAASTLGMSGARKTWQLTGPSMKLHLTLPVPCPAHVTLSGETDPNGNVTVPGIIEEIRTAGVNDLILGIGQESKVTQVSLQNDSPHLALSADSGKGKALALDTPVPTPSGWATMGELKAGDWVFDETGKPCRVTRAWAVRYDRPCYEVEFSDGTVITADAEHQWLTHTLAYRRALHNAIKVGLVKPSKSTPKVVTTEQIKATLNLGPHANHAVSVAAALQCLRAELPVSPYTLGAWLGDGSSWRGQITTADPEILAEIEAEGAATRPVPSSVKERHASYCVPGLATSLRTLGLFPDGANKRADKHIPVSYLRASEDQRRALLAGLLDTDGTCSALGQVEFVSTRERLAYDVLHLVAGLGYKVGIVRETARLYGKDCGFKWRVRFTPADRVFRLARKASRQITTARATASRRYITAVRAVPSVPVRCIAVDSRSHLFLVGETCIATHNSVVVRCILPQVLLRGGIAAILDNKLVSHPWARGLHNVAYCDDIAKIHDFLVWLDAELNRRAQFIRGHTDIHGGLTGSPGPRMMIVLEELNLMMNRLRTYWAELLSEDKARPKDMRENLPSMSPAIRAMENASYIGRELKVHLLFVSQRLSAKATAGSGDVRMNMGTRILAGYDAATWDMLVGKQTPMPAPSKIRGRMQVNVKGGDLHETQIAFFTHAEARELAATGNGCVPAKLRRLTEFDGPDVPAAGSAEAPDLLRNASQPPAGEIAPAPEGAGPVRNWITVRQAEEAGMLPRTWTKPGIAFRTAKSRAKKAGIPIPEVRGMRGTEAAYDAIEFADFIETITSTKGH